MFHETLLHVDLHLNPYHHDTPVSSYSVFPFTILDPTLVLLRPLYSDNPLPPFQSRPPPPPISCHRSGTSTPLGPPDPLNVFSMKISPHPHGRPREGKSGPSYFKFLSVHYLSPLVTTLGILFHGKPSEGTLNEQE